MDRDLGLLLVRMMLGGIFTAHGYPKVFGQPGGAVDPHVARLLGEGFVGFMERGGVEHFGQVMKRIGVPASISAPTAWFVGLIEVAAGPLLAVGWLTRPMAFLLAVIMVVAIWRVHGRNGLIAPEGYQTELALLAACLALLATGPGRLAFDEEGR
jgi:putative oxidoreductase